MKKQLFVVSAAVTGLALGAAIALGADSKGAGIVGSVHDMNAVAGFGAISDPGQRVCAFCHSPHHAVTDNQTDSADVANLDVTDPANPAIATYKIYAPLWSRSDLANVGVQIAYQSQTFNPDSQNKPYDPLIGPSRLCLTCHDGTIALDAYYGNPGTTGNTTTDEFSFGGAGNIAVGKTMGLSNDHPIGMKYSDFKDKTAPGVDYELNADTTRFQKTDGTQSTKTIASVLYSDPMDANVTGFVTCASCHDVHNGKDVGNRAPLSNMRGYLLYGSQVDSSFCLTCHDKNAGVVPQGN